MGTNLQGYHLLWPDLPTFSQLQFTASKLKNVSALAPERKLLPNKQRMSAVAR